MTDRITARPAGPGLATDGSSSGPQNGRSSGRTGVLARLDGLRSLPANWDGYGAAPVAVDLLAAVKAFLDALPDESFPRPDREADGVGPAVVPLSSGAVQLEWHVGPRLLELEFESPTTIHYLKWWPPGGLEEEGSYPVSEGRRSAGLIEWVLRGRDPE